MTHHRRYPPNEGRRTVLWKRFDDDDQNAACRRATEETFRDIFVKGMTASEAGRRSIAGATGYNLDATDADRRVQRDNDGGKDTAPSSAGAKHASELADLVAEASKGEVDRATALDWLLHDPHGRAMAQMHKRQMSKQQKEIPAMPDNTFSAVIKNHGVVAFSKAVVDCGRCDGAVTEQEFTAAVTDYAKAQARPGETPDAAFARVFTASDEVGLLLRKACAVIKGETLMTLQPTFVGGNDAVSVNNPTAALAQLRALAEKMRAANPQMHLSEAQAFSMVFTDPANRELAARERQENRPSA